VRFVGRIGRDDFPLRVLQAEGVDVTHVGRDDGESGVAVILVAQSGENVIVVAPGANRRLTPAEVTAAMAGAAPDAVICQQEIPPEAIGAAAAAARRVDRGAGRRPLFCLNAAPARGPVDPALKPDLLIVNRYEQELAGTSDGLVALTLGAEGAVLLESGTQVARARPPRVQVVDGTAAGDAFCAALVISLLQERELQHALERACAAGALAASRPGAQPSLPKAAELEEVLEQ
jgi:ribokinase